MENKLVLNGTTKIKNTRWVSVRFPELFQKRPKHGSENWTTLKTTISGLLQSCQGPRRPTDSTDIRYLPHSDPLRVFAFKVGPTVLNNYMCS